MLTTLPCPALPWPLAQVLAPLGADTTGSRFLEVRPGATRCHWGQALVTLSLALALALAPHHNAMGYAGKGVLIWFGVFFGGGGQALHVLACVVLTGPCGQGRARAGEGGRRRRAGRHAGLGMLAACMGWWWRPLSAQCLALARDARSRLHATACRHALLICCRPGPTGPQRRPHPSLLLPAPACPPPAQQQLQPDGTFPNHPPNPEHPAAMASGAAAVRDNNADLGIVFDTDVDRCGCVAWGARGGRACMCACGGGGGGRRPPHTCRVLTHGRRQMQIRRGARGGMMCGWVGWGVGASHSEVGCMGQSTFTRMHALLVVFGTLC